MTSMFTFISDKWKALDPAWRVSIFAYLGARLVLSAWALVVCALIPLAVSNLNLHGEPVIAVFDLGTSTRAVFSRVLAGRELHFRPAPPNFIDGESNTVWDLGGRAVSGVQSGASLLAAAYSAEDVFPYRGVAPSSNILLSVWQRFDVNWYIKIAQRGYGDDGSKVYFPLYPFLIRVLGTLLQNRDLLAAMIISNLALVGAIYLLYQISRELLGHEESKRAVVFFIFFPTAFFLFAPYTESLFLLFVLATLREGMRRRWNRAGVLGALASLTRLQGVLMIVPLAYLAWKDIRAYGQGITSQARLGPLTLYLLRFTPLLLLPVSTLGFFAYTNLSLLSAYESQLHARFVFPWDNILASVALVANVHASPTDLVNLFFTLLFGMMVIAVWFRLPRELGLYSLGMYLAPLFRMTTEQPLVSMARYALYVFPVFILWGAWGRNTWVARMIVYLSIPLQLFLSAQFFLWGWVG